ncbi:MAG: spermidine synthase [bacterium]|jgi:spermidine synthase
MEKLIIERVPTPQGELQLQRRGEEYEIIANGVFIMATYNRASERILAAAALTALVPAAGEISVLIGGLGIGYTLAATLADPRVNRVTVVELEPVIVDWCRKYFEPYNNYALRDDRTVLLQSDVLAFARDTPDCYDAILLDVDNGPDFLLYASNVNIYRPDGLRLFRDRLRTGGVLSVWSGQRSDDFLASLRDIFGNGTEVPVPRLDDNRLEPDYVYWAKR